MPLLTLEQANTAWGDILAEYLREPTEDEIAKLMPPEYKLPIAEWTVGDYLDFKKELWLHHQQRNLIGLLRKETAFARRNEHHQLAKIFGKDIMNSLTEDQKKALHARFDELNEAVKGKF